MNELPPGFEIPDLKIGEAKKIDMTMAEYVGAVTRVALAMYAQALVGTALESGRKPTEHDGFIFVSAALLQIHKGQVVDGTSALWLKAFLANARVAADISQEYWDKFCPVKFTA